MLIDDQSVMRPDPILAAIATSRGASDRATRITTGVYEIGHFGGTVFLPNYEHYPDFGGERGSYGVCDNIDQILALYSELDADDRRFVVTLTRIRRADQSESGGWRWHKWGEYIGTQKPEHEYLYDDTHIDEVFVYHIYERMP